MESFELGMFAVLEYNQPDKVKQIWLLLAAFESVFTEVYQRTKSTDYFYKKTVPVTV